MRLEIIDSAKNIICWDKESTNKISPFNINEYDPHFFIRNDTGQIQLSYQELVKLKIALTHIL